MLAERLQLDNSLRNGGVTRHPLFLGGMALLRLGKRLVDMDAAGVVVSTVRGRRAARGLVLALLLAAVGLAAAGCGGGTSPSVANVDTTTSAAAPASAAKGSASPGPALTPQQETAIDDAYAACMTGHGIEARAIKGGGVGFITHPGSPGPGSPTFTAAQRACKHLLPKGGLPAPTQAQIQARVAELRKLSGCMRSHGVAKFPDPSSDGSLLITPSSGIDPNSPQFQTAQKDCAQYFPGGPPPPVSSHGG